MRDAGAGFAGFAPLYSSPVTSEGEGRSFASLGSRTCASLHFAQAGTGIFWAHFRHSAWPVYGTSTRNVLSLENAVSLNSSDHLVRDQEVGTMVQVNGVRVTTEKTYF